MFNIYYKYNFFNCYLFLTKLLTSYKFLFYYHNFLSNPRIYTSNKSKCKIERVTSAILDSLFGGGHFKKKPKNTPELLTSLDNEKVETLRDENRHQTLAIDDMILVHTHVFPAHISESVNKVYF